MTNEKISCSFLLACNHHYWLHHCTISDVPDPNVPDPNVPDPGVPATSQDEPASGDPWPKTAQLDGATYTVYQPQLDSWDSFNMAAHAAVSVLQPGSQTPVFGVLKLTAKTKVDRLARTVYFTDTTVQSANFPSAPNWATSYQRAFQALFVKGPFTIALDRVEAALAELNAQNQGQVCIRREPRPAVRVLNDTGCTGHHRRRSSVASRRRNILRARPQHAATPPA